MNGAHKGRKVEISMSPTPEGKLREQMRALSKAFQDARPILDELAASVRDLGSSLSKFRANQAPRAQTPYGKRILYRFTRNGREHQFHATKGWRSYRAGKDR